MDRMIRLTITKRDATGQVLETYHRTVRAEDTGFELLYDLSDMGPLIEGMTLEIQEDIESCGKSSK